MIDDKVIEAALDAYYSALEWRKKPETYMHDMRAALAAADKVRAEGFDVENAAEERADWVVDATATSTQNRAFLRGDPDEDYHATEAIYLNSRKAILIIGTRAFAAGLAKGEADKAALVDALEAALPAVLVVCELLEKGGHWAQGVPLNARDRIHAALALVRKGV